MRTRRGEADRFWEKDTHLLPGTPALNMLDRAQRAGLERVGGSRWDSGFEVDVWGAAACFLDDQVGEVA
jgi:hypothetical protein